MLAEKEIQVSRRAIAKYRLELNIPSSSKEKDFKRRILSHERYVGQNTSF